MDIGTRDYMTVWNLQEKLMTEVQNGGLNKVLTVEHPHVYTLGRNGNEANMLSKPPEADLYRVNRGGDITYHGPGQLVVYPIVRLYDFGGDIKAFVHGLEEVVIRTIAELGIEGARIAKATGVWLEPQTPVARKICAIGLRCSHAVTMHGFALNVNTNLEFFNYINPCGIKDKGVTSIERETGVIQDMNYIKTLVIKYFTAIFGMDFQ
jgi:lipoyl(octanoyl) transferase